MCASVCVCVLVGGLREAHPPMAAYCKSAIPRMGWEGCYFLYFQEVASWSQKCKGIYIIVLIPAVMFSPSQQSVIPLMVELKPEDGNEHM